MAQLVKTAIPISKSSLPTLEAYMDEVRDSWNSWVLGNTCKKQRMFEQQLAGYLKTPHLQLFSNGHFALESILRAMNIEGEVITTPFTFSSIPQSIVNCGCIPVFCDIDPTTFTIDVEKIEALITDKTSAIVAVHIYGNICDVEALRSIANHHQLKLIFDIAHAFDVTCNGESMANYGDASMFSFCATKAFHSIEGGAITYLDEGLSRILSATKNFGTTNEGDVQFISGNSKMSEFQAVMALSNLRIHEEELLKRKQVFERYMERLNNIQGLSLPLQQRGIKQNYTYFPIVLNDNRDALFEALIQEKIWSRNYLNLLTNVACYKQQYSVQETPVAHSVADRIITLPIDADLPLHEVDRICAIISNFYGIYTK